MIPKNLPADPAQAYKQGWTDHARKMSAKGGKQTSEAKAAAAKANGAKGGRPRKDKK